MARTKTERERRGQEKVSVLWREGESTAQSFYPGFVQRTIYNTSLIQFESGKFQLSYFSLTRALVSHFSLSSFLLSCHLSPFSQTLANSTAMENLLVMAGKAVLWVQLASFYLSTSLFSSSSIISLPTG